MEKHISRQEETMSKQKRRINILKRHLRTKGDVSERHDAESKIESDMTDIKEEVKLLKLDYHITRLNAYANAQQVSPWKCSDCGPANLC